MQSTQPVKSTQQHSEEKILREKLPHLFSDIPQVDSVYVMPDSEGAFVTVLLANDVFDEALMDALLDKELALRDEIRSLQVDFRYMPRLGRDRSDCVPTASTLIYKAP